MKGRRKLRARIDSSKIQDGMPEVERICSLPLPKNLVDCAREIELLGNRQRQVAQRVLELSGESDRFAVDERKEKGSQIEEVEATSLYQNNTVASEGSVTEAPRSFPTENKQSSEVEPNTGSTSIRRLNTLQITEKIRESVKDRKSEGFDSGMRSPLIIALTKLQEEHQERRTIKEWIWNLARLFRSSDRDKSGTLNSDEYLTMIEILDVSEELKASLGLKFNDIDENQSGLINIKEFLNFFLLLPTFNDELNMHAYSNAPFLNETGLSRLQKWRLYLYNIVEVHNYNAASKILYCSDLMLAIVPTVVFFVQSVRPSYYISWSERNYIWGISTFYAIEYLCGLLTCKSSITFVNNGWHTMDLVSFVFWFIYSTILYPGTLNPMGFVIFRTVRLMKITRVFDLQTIREDLLVYRDTIQLAWTSYEPVAGFMLLSIVFFSLLIYVFERGTFDDESKTWVRDDDEGESPFSNFFDCVWFTAVTMTTVGYGDLSPKSAVGKLIAILAACCGVCNITLLINIIGECFEDVFRDFVTKRAKKIAENKKKFIEAQIYSACKSATRGKVNLQLTAAKGEKITSESLHDTVNE